MAGSSSSQNHNFQETFKTIPEEIHDELITIIVSQPFDENDQKNPEKFNKRINTAIANSSLSFSATDHFHFDEKFLSKLKFGLTSSERADFIALGCFKNGVFFNPCK